MKKLLLIFGLVLGLSNSLFALSVNECKTDIYFGNGVWNKQFSRSNCNKDSAAECSQKELTQIIQREIIKNNPLLQAKYGTVKLQYNWGEGYMPDVLETYYQLKKEGQVNDLEFFMVMSIITGGNVELSTYATGVLLESMPFVAEVEQENVDTMLKKYYKESFQYSHRVLLVSHSQGNLFANRVYDSIDPKGYQNYFANVQVASPASSVHAAKGTYITGWVDPVINPIPGSMGSNADLDGLGGHKFVKAYLDSADTYKMIVAAIKKELGILDDIDQTTSQWTLDQEAMKCGNCEDMIVKIKHRFDRNIKLEEDVLPYNVNNYKIYPVDGKYVMAECGGIKIEDNSQDDESKTCSTLIGTNESIPKMKTLLDGVCIGIVNSDIEYSFEEEKGELLVGSIGDNYWTGTCTDYMFMRRSTWTPPPVNMWTVINCRYSHSHYSTSVQVSNSLPSFSA